MNNVKQAMCLYAITDRTWLNGRSLQDQVEQALKGGATCIQLREKELDEDTFLTEAKVIRDLCQDYKVPFIINDNVKLAREVGADGVHVGQSDMPVAEVRKSIGQGKIVGVSAQTVEQAVQAEKEGADYLGVGAVFSTSTKLDANHISKKVLKDICQAVHIPVVAIGGITKQNMLELTGTQVSGVALVSAIFASNNIEENTRDLLELSKQLINKGERQECR
ncbi:MAG: thiamine phosphate synthase [bacterium]|nr:thiamine phosphate synthase [bacterium]